MNELTLSGLAAWEDTVAIAFPVLAIAALLAIGYFRDRNSRAAFRAFAQRHGLEVQEDRAIAGLPGWTGRDDGQHVYAGYVWIKPFTEGIGPTFGGRSVAVVALTVGSTERIDRQSPVVREFLQSNGTLTEKAITYSFPRRHFKAIRVAEIDAAFALVRQVAAMEK
jgi:hypothetical protein